MLSKEKKRKRPGLVQAEQVLPDGVLCNLDPDPPAVQSGSGSGLIAVLD